MDEKTFVFPEGAGSGSNSVDPNLLLAMNNGGGFGGGMWNNPIWAIVLLAFLRNGFGWGGGDGNCSNGFISSQLGQAIQGNANAISNLATSLNCTEGQILGAVNAVQSAIQSVGAQNNLSFAQTVNAVNAGNANIISTLQSCCCDVKQLVTTQGYENRINNLQQSQLIQNGFAQVGYAAAENACAIKQNATDNTGRVLAKLDAIEDSRKDREINTLTAALTAANSRAERQAELAPIYQALNDIKCKQPQTFNVPYQPFTAIPNCVAYGMGLYGAGYGFNPGGNIWS
ncbi:MAG: hypothetical protein MJZ12_00340 [Prevotella sp.]|nr:hypothetical protein [Prevotella sp.]